MNDPASETTSPDPREPWVRLEGYTPGDYRPGRSRLGQVVWYAVSVLLFESGCFPIARVKPTILRWFGAKIGRGVVIKPHVRIKYPWRLSIGDHVWIGQESWIDNLADVRIGSHVCVSQRAYLCTGSHDPLSRGFDLRIGEIELGDGSWVGASAVVLGGVTIGPNAILAAGGVAARDLPPAKIAGGVPARVLRDRQPPAS